MTQNERKTKKLLDDIHLTAICLNDQTVGNLKKYLNLFPKDAKVVITDWKQGNFDCCICCNFEHQIKTNIVQLMAARPIEV